MTSSLANIGLVVIGRNEGGRLRRCILSASRMTDRIVYVDSGSTDGSVELAKGLNVEVVDLDMSWPFSAARARNSGFSELQKLYPDLQYVQFVDGDCEVRAGWIEKAQTYLKEHRDIAVVSGRCRERFPEKTVYNQICDREWNTPVGEAKACGGNAMMRIKAFKEVGGFRDDLIAGEEPELCLRLRHKGWKVWRLEAEMVLHDAAMSRFGQWWKRSVRAGYSYANVTWLHRRSDERFWRRSLFRIIVWGGLLPLLVLAAAFFIHPFFALGLLLYPLQIVRIALTNGVGDKANWIYAVSTVIDKFPGLQGVVQFYLKQATRGTPELIEYK
ncbi:MAG: glycosyltransferase [Hyphomicrobiaceae bacterium]|nr:glycosyltransferase [Hyphomicrobiaceae bacterium]